MENSIAKIYEYTEKTHNGYVVIRIRHGEYEGVEYTYEKLSVDEGIDKKSARLNFNINLVENPKEVIIGEEFYMLAGDIVIELLDNWLEESANESENRTDDITDIDDKRRFLSQGDPISEIWILPR